jgi:UDP-N-acetylglucosamine:LPS N-acetylglucosamine transferase
MGNLLATRGGRTDDDRRAEILLISTPGGHLVQLSSLRDAWRGYGVVWVTGDTSDARSILEGERVYYGFGPAERSIVNFARNLRLAWRLLRTLRPKLIVSTGAAMCVPFVWIGRLLGVKVFYIESVTRIEGPSLTGRLVAPLAHRVYVQWPELQQHVRGSKYVGSVFPVG